MPGKLAFDSNYVCLACAGRQHVWLSEQPVLSMLQALILLSMHFASGGPSIVGTGPLAYSLAVQSAWPGR